MHFYQARQAMNTSTAASPTVSSIHKSHTSMRHLYWGEEFQIPYFS